jgi:hypothetical protein
MEVQMHKLELRGILLYLNGGRNTLKVAQAHNTRNIPIELEAFHHIDSSKVHLNKELVALDGRTLEQTVIEEVTRAGIDIKKGQYKRSDKAYAIEWMFSVTHGYECDFEQLYKKCLEWLQSKHPTCPIVYAVIHYDEGDPHLHVIMVPISGKHMPASKILGFKGCSRSRAFELYEKVGLHFGLAYAINLKGNAKKLASQKALKELEKRHYREKFGELWQPIKSAIQARPEPFLEALGILFNAHLKDDELNE